MGGLAWRSCSPSASDGIRAAAMLLPILAEDVDHDWIRWLSCRLRTRPSAAGIWRRRWACGRRVRSGWSQKRRDTHARDGCRLPRTCSAPCAGTGRSSPWSPEDFFADGETVIVRGMVRAVAKAAGRPMDGYGGSVCARVHGQGWTDPAADQPSRHRTVVAGARHLTAARALSAGRVRRGGMMRQDNNVEVAREAFAGWSCPRGQMPVLRRLATWPADLESNLRGLLSAQLCYLCGARKNDDMMTGSTAARFSFAGFRLLPGP
jgi:hypothetical protein